MHGSVQGEAIGGVLSLTYLLADAAHVTWWHKFEATKSFIPSPVIIFIWKSDTSVVFVWYETMQVLGILAAYCVT